MHTYRCSFSLVPTCWLLLIGLFIPTILPAQYATGGAGQYQSDIYWFEWSTQGMALSENLVENFTLPDGSNLSITFTNVNTSVISSTTYPHFHHTESFYGNKLDDYYTGPDPITIYVQSPVVYTFTMTFSRTGGLSGLPLHLIYADAEDNKDVEYTEVTTNGDDWQVLELMTYSAEATIKSNNTQEIRFYDSDKTLRQQGNYPGAYYPGGIYLTQNATELDVTVTSGGGFSAVAFGVWMPFDFGDVSGYGEAAHLNLRSLTGGTNPTAGVDVTRTFTSFLSSGSEASVSSPTLCIGSSMDSDGDSSSANADADADGADDDGATFSDYDGSTNYDLDISITNTTGSDAYLVAYMDFNADGDFEDANEQSTTTTVGSSGDYTVSFSGLPVQIRSDIYTRVRLSSNQSQVESPTGYAIDGEVEDYRSPQMVFPVELVDFTATAMPQGVCIRWSTASELNADYFDLERTASGEDWHAIVRLPAQGTTQEMSYYEGWDYQPQTDRVYYRLRQVDFNGTVWYSPKISHMYQATSMLAWWDGATIRVRVPENMTHATLKDASGRTVYQWQFRAPYQLSGHLPTEGLPKGTYYLQVKGESDWQQWGQKLLLQ